MQKWEFCIVERCAGKEFKVMYFTEQGTKPERIKGGHDWAWMDFCARLGNEGWELLSVLGPNHYFKRPKP